MKKVTCIVLYTRNKGYFTLNNITVKHKGNNITLYDETWDTIDKLYQYKYVILNDLYTTVLNFLKNNNYYVYKWKDFNKTFYDIDFIESNTLTVDRFSYNQ